ncbi:hypothetical protein GYH30_047538 [Glycine max]|uniref:Uncharacterized protein n=1 Tax=Glycine max TaxID=3847 RepID=A0A0R0FDX7_SOYBN|nr:hypothetical protein GYH30_047538 [Glycine max]
MTFLRVLAGRNKLLTEETNPKLNIHNQISRKSWTSCTVAYSDNSLDKDTEILSPTFTIKHSGSHGQKSSGIFSKISTKNFHLTTLGCTVRCYLVFF